MPKSILMIFPSVLSSGSAISYTFMFIKTELKQGSNKPLFYAVLGILDNMLVFNSSDSDTLTIML